MESGTNTEIVIRFWDTEFIKKNIRHLRIVMLPGMNEDFGMFLPELPRDRGTLDELGAGPNNGNDLQDSYLRRKMNVIDSGTMQSSPQDLCVQTNAVHTLMTPSRAKYQQANPSHLPLPVEQR